MLFRSVSQSRYPTCIKCDVSLGDKHIVFRSKDYDAVSIMFSRVLRELLSVNADDMLDFGD